jgi:hypothetical protein
MNFHQTRVSVETVLPLYSTLKFGHLVKVCAFLRNRPSRLARKRELVRLTKILQNILPCKLRTIQEGRAKAFLRGKPFIAPTSALSFPRERGLPPVLYHIAIAAACHLLSHAQTIFLLCKTSIENRDEHSQKRNHRDT